VIAKGFFSRAAGNVSEKSVVSGRWLMKPGGERNRQRAIRLWGLNAGDTGRLRICSRRGCGFWK